MNEDTSLKPHERYVLDAGEWGTTDAMANKEAETVNSKYVVVRCRQRIVLISRQSGMQAGESASLRIWHT